MHHHTLIVARLREPEVSGIADAFAESDSSELPNLIGVSRRTLFRFHDLYFHLVEANHDVSANLGRMREHPLYQQIDERLRSFVAPYDPNWREPKDAMAQPFYTWSVDEGRTL